jgi:choline-sulfatase
MAGPGVPEGKRIKANCSLVDLLPTLVDLAINDEWEG